MYEDKARQVICQVSIEHNERKLNYCYPCRLICLDYMTRIINGFYLDGIVLNGGIKEVITSHVVR